MDQDRQIRFLYPPFFLVMSVLWGLYLDPSRSLNKLLPIIGNSTFSASEALGLLAGGGILVLALGFLIGSTSLTLLRCIFWIFGKCHFEAAVSPDALKSIGKYLRVIDTPSKKYVLSAVATFDNEILSPNVNGWIHRRWMAFTTSAHSCTAIFLATIICISLSITFTWAWIIPNILCFGFLALNAFFAWRDAMEMIEFQSQRILRPDQKLNKPTKKYRSHL
jgi:hypothetical protein